MANFSNRVQQNRHNFPIFFISSWSFGVVLWEIFSLGEDPYPGVTNEEMVTFIHDERRMTCPKACPKHIYGLMVDCWQTVSCKRPTFQILSARVDGILKQHVSVFGKNFRQSKIFVGNLPIFKYLSHFSADFRRFCRISINFCHFFRSTGPEFNLHPHLSRPS